MIKYLKIGILLSLVWWAQSALAQDTIPLNTTYAFEVNYTEGNTYSWWFTNETGVITELESTTNKTEEYFWDTEGEFQIMVQTTDINGCLSEIIFRDYVVVDIPTDLIVYAGNDTIIGSNNPYQLQATVSDTTGLSYLWGPAENLDDPTLLNPVFTPGSTTTFILTVTDASGNQVSDTVTIRVSEIFADAGNNVIIEEGSTVELDGSGSIGRELQYLWTTNNGTIDNGENTATPTISSAGIYYLQVTDYYGAISIDSVQVKEGGTDLIVSAGNDTIIGSNNPYQLQATVSDTTGLSYLWGPAENLDDPTLLNPVFTPGSTTTFILTVTDASGNQVSDTVTIGVSEILADAGNDVIIEEGSTVELDGSESIGRELQYLWTTNNGIIDNGENTATPTISSVGIYYLQVTDYYGAISIDSVLVKEGGAGLPLVSAGNDTIVGSCNPFLLQAAVSDTTGLSYLWEPSTNLNDATLLNPVFTPGSTTTFVLTVTTVGGREVRDTVEISISDIYANAGDDFLIEEGSSAMLDGTASLGEELKYSWSTFNGIIDSGENTATPIISSTGTYYLQVTDLYDCVENDSVVVSLITYAPIANDDYDTTDFQTAVRIYVLDNDYDPEGDLDPTTLSIQQYPVNGTVFINDDYSISYMPNDGFIGDDSFEYQICDLTAKCDNAYVYVAVLPVDFFIPQAFSPNGDNINDYFEIVGIEYYEGNSITIINRWGEMVYEATNYGISTTPKFWDGKWQKNASDLPTGTYFYVLDLGNGKAPIAGSIYIDR